MSSLESRSRSRKLTRSDYSAAQREAVRFAHQYSEQMPKIAEATNDAEERLRRAKYISGWGGACEGFKAGYRAGLRAARKP